MTINIIPVLKNTSEEQLVPTVWRKTLSDIVNAFKSGDFQLKKSINGVNPILPKDASIIEHNISDYGITLKSLPPQTWKTSTCLYLGDFWDVFIDLYSIEEGLSDLVLSVRVYEKNSEYIFDVHLVYVP